MALFPMPKVIEDVGPGGPIVTGMQAFNALRQSDLENKIKGIQAQYEPYTLYSNALSKSSYGQTAPALALATFMSGPAAQYLDRNTLNSLGKQMQEYTKNIMGNNIIPPPSQMNQTGGFINFFKNLISGQGQVTNSLNVPNQIQQQQHQQNQNIPSQPSNNIVKQPEINITPPSKIQGITPANQLYGAGGYSRQAAGTAIPGTVGGMTPQAGSSATEKGLEAGVTEEAKNETTRMNEMIKSDKQAADLTSNTVMLLNKAKDARSRMNFLQAGPIGGNLPAVTTAANDYDSSMAGIVSQIAKADSMGNLTDDGRKLAEQTKAPRGFTDEAFNHIYEYTYGLQKRTNEKPLFNHIMSQLGYNSNQIPILWNYYQTKRPFYDNKTHTQNEDNINSWDEFYADDKNFQSAFSPKAQKEIDKMMGSKKSYGKSTTIPEVKISEKKPTSIKTTIPVKHGDITYLYQNGIYYK